MVRPGKPGGSDSIAVEPIGPGLARLEALSPSGAASALFSSRRRGRASMTVLVDRRGQERG